MKKLTMILALFMTGSVMAAKKIIPTTKNLNLIEKDEKIIDKAMALADLQSCSNEAKGISVEIIEKQCRVELDLALEAGATKEEARLAIKSL